MTRVVIWIVLLTCMVVVSMTLLNGSARMMDYLLSLSSFSFEEADHASVVVVGSSSTEEKKQHETLLSANNKNDDVLRVEKKTPIITKKNASCSDHVQVVVLVMSSRTNFERRNVIRETWGGANTNNTNTNNNAIYFLLGRPCPYPPELRTSNTTCQPRKNDTETPSYLSTDNNIDDNNNNNNNTLHSIETAYQTQLEAEETAIVQEQTRYGDIIFTSETTPESYRSLPNKLKAGFDFVVRHCKHAMWIIKADDDFYVKVNDITNFLLNLTTTTTTSLMEMESSSATDTPMLLSWTKNSTTITNNNNNTFDPTTTIPPVVIGNIQWNHLSISPVLKTGKNAEFDYKPRTYPNFPLGSAGYAVTLPIAQYVANNQHHLFEYQGEDTCLGIWIKEGMTVADETTSNIKDVIWIKAAKQPSVWEYRLRKTNRTIHPFVWGPNIFSEQQDCTTTSDLLVIGHDLDIAAIRKCHDLYQQQQDRPGGEMGR